MVPNLVERIVAAACVFIAAAGTFYAYQIAPNKYEVAQHQTAFVEVDGNGGGGSGVFIHRDNQVFVLTAAHVVDETSSPFVDLFVRDKITKEKYATFKFPARVIVEDKEIDLALLWIPGADPKWFSYAGFAESNPARVGSECFHVGNFHGISFDGSVSTGVVSQVGVVPENQIENGWPWKTTSTDQTTATIVRGSSGGAVFDGSGNILGIAVGTVDPGVNIFLPVRVVELFAQKHGITWLVRGKHCPTVQQLQSLTYE